MKTKSLKTRKANDTCCNEAEKRELRCAPDQPINYSAMKARAGGMHIKVIHE